MAPLYTPSMLFGISLIYLFGRQGLVTTGFFGNLAWLAWDIGIYGPVGIVIGESLLTFPAAVMIIGAALENTDARLFEAAASLGASRLRIFLTVTLPGARYGIFNAIFAVFTLCFTDFGVPKVIGGNTPILATEIYKQVVGQQNFGLGAVISLILLTPALVASFGELMFRQRQAAALTARAQPYLPKPFFGRDLAFFSICFSLASAILVALAAAGFASLVRVWPYRLEIGFWHYRFQETGGGGLNAFHNSVHLALWSSAIGTALAFGSAYLIEKTRELALLRKAIHTILLLPLALPGLVIGISYILFFNSPYLDYGVVVPNLLRGLYATPALIVLSNIVHFFTVAYLTALAALRQLDREFEAAAETLGVSFARTFWRITVPLCLPAIVEIAVYFFVSAMATVSAVIFLCPPGYPLAAVAVVNMDDAGDTAPAAAMSMLILAANSLARAGGEIALRLLARMQRWKRRGKQ
ncbi:MAG: ABC transporter permease subunit, partial [Planctomycetota bacterium]|nr:ABC transporter permease subunit [Planctomycetota bacterium]